MKKIELNFSNKKDKKVMRWLETLKDMGEDSSPYVVLALEYYISTGRYLSLGSVNSNTEPSDKIRKTFYIPNNSSVEGWSDELIQRKKGLLSTQIRYILDNCIETSEKGEIIPYAELVMQAEKEIYTNINNDIIKKPQQYMIEKAERKSIAPSMQYYEEQDSDEIEENDARQQAIETMYNALLPDVDEE